MNYNSHAPVDPIRMAAAAGEHIATCEVCREFQATTADYRYPDPEILKRVNAEMNPSKRKPGRPKGSKNTHPRKPFKRMKKIHTPEYSPKVEPWQYRQNKPYDPLEWVRNEDVNAPTAGSSLASLAVYGR